ncbi:MAG TPA: N-acetyltransferase [Micromonosporaceae bacterium]
MLVRREQRGDVATVRRVVAAAFSRPDVSTEPSSRVPAEVTLLDQLRVDTAWLPVLSLVAVAPDGTLVGHVVCTRGAVGRTPALGLGPLAVRPDRQRRGVGKALMHAVLGAAEALDESLVALLGDPRYYRRYGFRPAVGYGITPPNPEWGDFFQVRTLSAYQSVFGTFRYAEPFNRL